MSRKFIIMVFLLLGAGCSYYSMSSALPAHIKTAAVPLFENETVEVDIVEYITAEVIDAFIKDGNLNVVGELQADAIVNGTIVDIIEEADIYSKEEEAEQFKIRIFADVTFFDHKKNNIIWEGKRMEGWALFDSADPDSREESIKEALEMLAKEIIDKTVTGW